VALNLNNRSTRDREINALETAMKECRLKQARLITLDERETFRSKTGVIEILPAWHWAIYGN
jgi:predicted AAA+ superfamily ATPase